MEQFLLLFCIFGENGQDLVLVWWVFLKNIIAMHCKLMSVHYSLAAILHSLRKACVWLFYSFIDFAHYSDLQATVLRNSHTYTYCSV